MMGGLFPHSAGQTEHKVNYINPGKELRGGETVLRTGEAVIYFRFDSYPKT